MSHMCGSCGAPIEVGTTVYLLQSVRLGTKRPNASWGYYPHIGKSGDFERVPYFFHDRCGEDLAYNLADEIGPTEPLTCVTSACSCNFCGEPIHSGDVCGVIYRGKLEVAQRCPNSEVTVEHRPDGTARYLCDECMCTLNAKVLPGLWGDE